MTASHIYNTHNIAVFLEESCVIEEEEEEEEEIK